MNVKTVIQILMIFLIFLISLFLYLKYFKKSLKNLEKNKIIEKINTNKNTSSTYIDNINYISSDDKGNKYQITAEQAEIDVDDSNTMFLKNILAYVFINDSSVIMLTSDFGKYNTKNYDTIFSKNLTITYPGHKITSEYLDFSFFNNVGTISTNVIYTSNKTNLVADKIEMNLINKDTKIFMNDNTKKVSVEVNR